MVTDAKGNPRPELFAADALHLSEAGYKLLAERVRPTIERLKHRKPEDDSVKNK
jgi:lysophospholipase L1-like esterase